MNRENDGGRAMSGQDEGAARIANVIMSTKCDLIKDGPEILGRAVLTAIREGWIPGVRCATECTCMVDGPECPLHSQIAPLRAQLAAAKAEGERVAKERDEEIAGLNERLSRKEAFAIRFAREADEVSRRCAKSERERDALAGLLDEAREFVAEVVAENAAKWGERLIHKQQPAIDCLARISAALAGKGGGDGPVVHPNHHWMVVFEESSVPPVTFTDESAARGYYAKCSANWNCHLFMGIESNCRDDPTPPATPTKDAR